MHLDAIRNEGLTEYQRRLIGHDWSHEFSDDARVYQAGRRTYRELLEARAELDPDGMIWNRIAPTPYQHRGQHAHLACMGGRA